MQLIGFKPKSSLKPYYNIRPSYFIYPDEEHVKGSSQFFDALINNLIEKDKIALVRFQPRRGVQLSFCALVP
jgi:ATP-dependent DNA helicase 2 subunit 1